MKREIKDIQELKQLVGETLGTSPWIDIDQQRIQTFADATNDHQWIHLDPERAEAESPYKNTIAHGLLTLSLLPWLRSQSFHVASIKTIINYGFNSVRFTAPVPTGSKIRGCFELMEVTDQANNAYLVKLKAQIEIEGSTRPACVAEMLGRYVD